MFMDSVLPSVIILLKNRVGWKYCRTRFSPKLNDKSVAAYQRGAMMDKRRLMMQRYANYAYQTGENVV